jgi:hypothetical protein
MNPVIQFKTTTLSPLIAFVLACFALSPPVQAQLPSPTPDGGYLNQNTAEGDGALFSLTTGDNNTAIGFEALHSNTSGNSNTASGDQSLFYNNGNNNTATGFQALGANTTGGDNVANGFEALHNNTTGTDNTATGSRALEGAVNNSTGNFNTANGFAALSSNTTGNNNIALGFNAGSSLTTGDNNIDIGNAGVAAEANTIRIGTLGTQTNAYIAGINGVDKSSGSPVFIDANGQLGTGSASPPGSVVMLPVSGGVAPPAPAGYVLKGFVLLAAKANGGGGTTSYAVYTKS